MDACEQTLVRAAQGYQLSQALYVVAKLGVADALGAGPLVALAEAVKRTRAQLRRVLRALVAAGVFVEFEDGRFASGHTVTLQGATAAWGQPIFPTSHGRRRGFGNVRNANLIPRYCIERGAVVGPDLSLLDSACARKR